MSGAAGGLRGPYLRCHEIDGADQRRSRRYRAVTRRNGPPGRVSAASGPLYEGVAGVVSRFRTSRTGCLKTSGTAGPAWRPGLGEVGAVRCRDVQGPACHYRHYRREAPGQRGGPPLRVARSWICTLLARYEAEGEAAFEPRSRRPKTSPSAISLETVELITGLRKELAGLDAGPQTIAWNL
jgi:hypothetical protein